MIRAVAGLMGAQMLVLAVNFLERIGQTAAFLHFWGVGLFEDWSVLVAFVSVLGLLELGLHQTFSNAYTQSCQGGDIAAMRRQIAIAIGLNASIALIGLMAWAIAACLLPAGVQTRAMPPSEAQGTMLLLGAGVLLNNFSTAIVPLYRAHGLLARALVIDAIATLLRLALLIAALAGGATPMAAAALQLATAAVTVLLVIPIDLRRLQSRLEFTAARPTRGEMLSIWRTAPYYFIQSLSSIALNAFPVLLLARIPGDPGVIATFVMARTLLNMGRQLLGALSIAHGNELSLHLASGRFSHDEIRRENLRSLRLLGVLSGGAFGLFLACAEAALRVWSAGKLHVDATVILALGLVIMTNAPYVGITTFMNLVGEGRAFALARVLTVLALLPLAFVLGPALGVVGIAIALTTSEAIGTAVACTGPLLRWSNISLQALLRWSALSTTAGLASVYLACLAAGTVLDLPVASGLFAKLLAATLAIIPVLLFVGLAKGDRDHVLSHSRRLLEWWKPARSSR